MKEELPMYNCPVCHAIIQGVIVETDEIKEYVRKNGRPMPVMTKCPNGHPVVLFVYLSDDGHPVVRDAISGKEGKKDWFDTW